MESFPFSPRLVSTTNLEIVVLDVNDNPPEFSSKAYFASVEEGSGNVEGGLNDVVRVLATSRDSGVNADIRYVMCSSADTVLIRECVLIFMVGLHK